MGNASRSRCTATAGSVHPHAHGERNNSGRAGVNVNGSSPRTWGTPGGAAAGDGPGRFIPTHMGNAALSQGAGTPTAVHPHAHGERNASRIVMSAYFGSSPRTWGTLLNRTPSGVRFRFIPTHMGNAAKDAGGLSPKSVHPHAHGERVNRVAEPTSADGSSPRTWGTQQ